MQDQIQMLKLNGQQQLMMTYSTVKVQMILKCLHLLNMPFLFIRSIRRAYESGNLPNLHPYTLHLHIRLVKRRRFSKVKSRWAGQTGVSHSFFSFVVHRVLRTISDMNILAHQIFVFRKTHLIFLQWTAWFMKEWSKKILIHSWT